MACGGDDDSTGSDGGGDGDGDLGSGGSSTGGNSSGGSTGAAPGSGGSATGGSDQGDSTIPELLSDAEEGCSTREMDVHVDFTDDNFEALLDGRVVDGSLTMESGDEVLAEESIAGDQVHLRWGGGVADGDLVAVSGWLEQNRATEENRYRCFDGEVIVRKDYFGALYYIFASETLYDATVDGTCGAPIAGEIAYGCLPDDY